MFYVTSCHTYFYFELWLGIYQWRKIDTGATIRATKPYFTCVCLILSWLHYVKRLGSVLPVGACVSWLIWSALQSAWKQGNVSQFPAFQLVFDQFSAYSLCWFGVFFLINCHVIRLKIDSDISAKDFSLTVGLRVSCIKKIYGTSWRTCVWALRSHSFSKGNQAKNIVLPCAMAVLTLVAHKALLFPSQMYTTEK